VSPVKRYSKLKKKKKGDRKRIVITQISSNYEPARGDRWWMGGIGVAKSKA